VGLRANSIKRRLHKLGVDTGSALVQASRKPELRAMLADAARVVDLHLVAKRRMVGHEGDHGSFFGDDERAAAQYEEYLRSIGCLVSTPALSMSLVTQSPQVQVQVPPPHPPTRGDPSASTTDSTSLPQSPRAQLLTLPQGECCVETVAHGLQEMFNDGVIAHSSMEVLRTTAYNEY